MELVMTEPSTTSVPRKGNQRATILLWLAAVGGILLSKFGVFDLNFLTIDWAKPLGFLLFTTSILLAALYAILSRKYGADAQKWAYGTVGTLLGYWLKVGMGP
jgi:hypothetical protein